MKKWMTFGTVWLGYQGAFWVPTFLIASTVSFFGPDGPTGPSTKVTLAGMAAFWITGWITSRAAKLVAFEDKLFFEALSLTIEDIRLYLGLLPGLNFLLPHGAGEEGEDESRS